MPQEKTDLIAEMLERARRHTLTVATDVPGEARCFQLREGKATPLWLVGHLANTINTVVLRWLLNEPSLLTREEAKCFAPDFGGGTPPCADPAVYPPWESVVSKYEEAMERAIKGVRGMHDGDLEQPLPEKIPAFFRERFPTVGDTLLQMIAHDAYHRGQVAMIAKLAPRADDAA